jgi:biotin carboxylase
VSRLDNFVAEATEDIVKIVVLTSLKDNGDEEDDGRLHKTAKIIKQTCIDKNIPYYLVFCENAYISKDDNDNSYIHNINDKKGFRISKKDTVVLVRGSVANSKSSLDLLSQIERREIFCVNSRQTIEECSDKFRTILKIADAGLLAPKTALVSNENGLKAAFERVGETFPIVMKTLTGAKGIGVFKADTWEGM